MRISKQFCHSTTKELVNKINIQFCLHLQALYNTFQESISFIRLFKLLNFSPNLYQV